MSSAIVGWLIDCFCVISTDIFSQCRICLLTLNMLEFSVPICVPDLTVAFSKDFARKRVFVHNLPWPIWTASDPCIAVTCLNLSIEIFSNNYRFWHIENCRIESLEAMFCEFWELEVLLLWMLDTAGKDRSLGAAAETEGYSHRRPTGTTNWANNWNGSAHDSCHHATSSTTCTSAQVNHQVK